MSFSILYTTQRKQSALSLLVPYCACAEPRLLPWIAAAFRCACTEIRFARMKHVRSPCRQLHYISGATCDTRVGVYSLFYVICERNRGDTAMSMLPWYNLEAMWKICTKLSELIRSTRNVCFSHGSVIYYRTRNSGSLT